MKKPDLAKYVFLQQMPNYFGLEPNNSQPVSSLLYGLHITDAMQSQQGPDFVLTLSLLLKYTHT